MSVSMSNVPCNHCISHNSPRSPIHCLLCPNLATSYEFAIFFKYCSNFTLDAMISVTSTATWSTHEMEVIHVHTGTQQCTTKLWLQYCIPGTVHTSVAASSSLWRSSVGSVASLFLDCSAISSVDSLPFSLPSWLSCLSSRSVSTSSYHVIQYTVCIHTKKKKKT